MKIPTVLNFGKVSYILEGEKDVPQNKFWEHFQNAEVLESAFLRPETSPCLMSCKACSKKNIHPVISAIRSFSIIDPELYILSCPIHSSTLVQYVSWASDTEVYCFCYCRKLYKTSAFLILQIQNCLGNDDLNLSVHLFYIKIASKRLKR